MVRRVKSADLRSFKQTLRGGLYLRNRRVCEVINTHLTVLLVEVGSKPLVDNQGWLRFNSSRGKTQPENQEGQQGSQCKIVMPQGRERS